MGVVLARRGGAWPHALTLCLLPLQRWHPQPQRSTLRQLGDLQHWFVHVSCYSHSGPGWSHRPDSQRAGEGGHPCSGVRAGLHACIFSNGHTVVPPKTSERVKATWPSFRFTSSEQAQSIGSSYLRFLGKETGTERVCECWRSHSTV